MDSRPWHRSYDAGVPASLAYDGQDLASWLGDAAVRHGQRTALVFPGLRWTFAELALRVDRLAAALTGLGVTRGTAVAVHLPNLPQSVLAILATLGCGGRIVMTNPLYTVPEIEHQWRDAGVEFAITADFLWAGALRAAAPRLPVRHWIVASIPELLPWPKAVMTRWVLARRKPPRVADFSEGPTIHGLAALLRRSRGSAPRRAVDLSDPAAIQYTGGTTGVSKGAVLTHANLASNVQQVRAWMGALGKEPQVVLAALPFFHVFGLTVGLLLPLRMGSTIVVAADPRDSRALLAAVKRERVTILPAVPAMLDALSARAGTDASALASVRGVFCGSAPLTEDTRRRFGGFTGARIFEGYGLTETSPVTHCQPVLGTPRSGSVGLPLPDTDAAIVDADDRRRRLPAGETGELLLKGPQVMAGYWRRAEETALVLQDGWFATGDLAVMDDEGWFRIVGRKKDMIVCAGYKVYPDEVDGVLCDHPLVAEACTIGVPDERRGETVKAFVVPVPGATLDIASLDSHCRERLAAYKVPRAYEIRASLPRSALQKLLRRTLRDEELARRAQGA